ncbi:MAG: hypothetical protein ACYDDF_03880 [Thermoplasmatota archaeon]
MSRSSIDLGPPRTQTAATAWDLASELALALAFALASALLLAEGQAVASPSVGWLVIPAAIAFAGFGLASLLRAGSMVVESRDAAKAAT